MIPIKPRKFPPLAILLLLFMTAISSISFSASFGRSTIKLERTWTIQGLDNTLVDFDGALAVNNTNHHVISIETTPSMEIEMKDDGGMRLHYKGQVPGPNLTLKGTAIIDIDYDTNLTTDPPLMLNGPRLDFTNLTEPSPAIEMQAGVLADNQSTLNTIKNLIDWVHGGVSYNISYLSLSIPAQQVFNERQGVCVEYSHLLISMARSLKLQTRYISGYVYGASWQPHAWVDIFVPGYGWLSVDPTFNQAGILDSSHVEIGQGADQAETYDLLLSDKKGALMSADDSLEVLSSSPDPKGISVSLSFDNSTYIVSSSIDNSRAEYIFGFYDMSNQDGYLKGEQTLILLKPNEHTVRYYPMSRSLFKEGFVYTVPLDAKFNDASSDLVVNIQPSTPAAPVQSAPESPKCLLPALLLFIAMMAVVLPWGLVEVISMRKKIQRSLPIFKKSSAHGAQHAKSPRDRRRAVRLDSGNQRPQKRG